MVSVRPLEIEGYQHESVPNLFFQAKEKASEHLALLLPGKGYPCAGPVLHYPLLELLDQGIDVLEVDYARRTQIRSWTLEQAQECALADTITAYQAIASQQKYKQLTLVGKSLGTLVMGELLASRAFSDPLQAIWLTPILRSVALCQQICQVPIPSLFVIGTADRAYDAERLAEVRQATGGEAVVIPLADHSLDIGTDAHRSLQAIERVREAIHGFLARFGQAVREHPAG
jgi:predicted alpha/beta-hydrolase family hydrolase